MPPTDSTAGVLGPAWLDMWVVAIGIFVALKLLTWWDARGSRADLRHSVAYLLVWPGMDAPTFLWGDATHHQPSPREWAFAAAKLFLGLALFGLAGSSLLGPELLRGWVGMAGLAFILHFGTFHLLSCLWRSRGIDAVPLMNWPVLSTSDSDFWSRRWNLAFRDLTHRYVFRPLAARIGGRAALWTGFLFSGLIHDAVISLPSRGGYGLPTLFFLIQAAAISVERSRLGKSVGLHRGATGWLWTLAVLLLPAPLLFHWAFLQNVVLPFLAATTGFISAPGW